jgi:hypothetical protein
MTKCAPLYAIALLLLACDTSSKRAEPEPTKASQPTFYCQRAATNRGEPIPFGTRTCDRQPLQEAVYGPSFTSPIAYCFTRSMLGIPPAHWGPETVESCSPTPSECKEDHDSVGSVGGQPPVKTECHKEQLAGR